MLPVVIFLLFEVNAFFLKFILWVPPRNMLNSYRLLILFLGAIPAVKVCCMCTVLFPLVHNISNPHVPQEYYHFIEAEHDPFAKLGASAWAALAIAVVETLVCIKHGHGMFRQPWPVHVVVFWGVVGVLLTLFIIAWSVQFYLLNGPKKAGKQNKKQL